MATARGESDEIVETARATLAADGITIPVFGCQDYTVVEIDNVRGIRDETKL